jgi:hypothetical protein
MITEVYCIVITFHSLRTGQSKELRQRAFIDIPLMNDTKHGRCSCVRNFYSDSERSNINLCACVPFCTCRFSTLLLQDVSVAAKCCVQTPQSSCGPVLILSITSGLGLTSQTSPHFPHVLAFSSSPNLLTASLICDPKSVHTKASS